MKILKRLDPPSWLMLILLAAAFVQIALTKVTGIMFFRGAYMAAFMGSAALAFLVLYRSVESRLLSRSVLYFIAVLLVYRMLPQVPAMIFGEPRPFDFLAFYLPAKVASGNLNLYSPDNFALIANQLPVQLDPHFYREIVDVGFMYPPWTAMLFLPLASHDYWHAAQYWYLFVAVTVIFACGMLAYMIHWRVNPVRNAWSILDCSALALVLVVSNALSCLFYGQTTALLACALITTVIFGGRPTSGVAAAIGVLIKPFAAVPALALLFGRYWIGLVAGALAGLVILLISIGVLGTDDWISYLGLNFSTQAPQWLYNEAGNHSLLAVLSRALNIYDVPWGHPELVTIYAAISATIVVITVWRSFRVLRIDWPTGYCLMLVAALLIYPGTLYTYAILLTIPIAVEFINQLKAKEHYLFTAFTLTALGGLWHWTLFAANLALLCLLVRRSFVVQKGSIAEKTIIA